VYAPCGSSVSLRGAAACVPRALLDDTLRRAAISAGASFFGGVKAIAPLVDGGVVTGATFLDARRGTETRLQARVTLLATGAAAESLQRFGVCRRSTPSATAARVYVRAASPPSPPELLISFDASICPGYGWIFPGPEATHNIGVGFFYDTWRRPATTNLRVLFERFVQGFEPARQLMSRATSVSPLRGAPLRTALNGARLSRAGLLVIGEAAGLTYSLTGEGIGKAMESGVLAALLACAHLRDGTSPDRLAGAYEEALKARVANKFRTYRRAQRLLSSPAVANWLSRRASRAGFVRDQLEAMFADTADAGALFSPFGLARALLAR
jgi:flavin-dependent dehydrogenase